MSAAVRKALFVMDLDETLLGPDKLLPARNRAALARAAAAGVTLAIVSGRRQAKLREVLPRFEGIPLRLAASNGAVLLAADSSSVEEVAGLDWSLALEVAGHPEGHAAPLLCITAAGDAGVALLSPHPRRWFHSLTPYRPETWQPCEERDARAASLVHLAMPCVTRAAAERLVLSLAAGIDGRASVHVVRHPLDPAHALLELVPVGGKGLAVRALCRRLRIEPERTGAVGDEANDVDLLAAAAWRYAVGGSVLARLRPDAREVDTAAAGGVGAALDDFVARMAG